MVEKWLQVRNSEKLSVKSKGTWQFVLLTACLDLDAASSEEWCLPALLHTGAQCPACSPYPTLLRNESSSRYISLFLM